MVAIASFCKKSERRNLLSRRLVTTELSFFSLPEASAGTPVLIVGLDVNGWKDHFHVNNTHEDGIRNAQAAASLQLLLLESSTAMDARQDRARRFLSH